MMKSVSLLLIYVFISYCALYAQNTPEMKEVKRIPCLFIHKIAINVKSQRIDRNPPAIYRYALIRGCPENENEQNMAVQVLTLQFEQQGVGFGIYQVLKVFNTYEEASTYAFMNDIRITSERQDYEKVLGYVPDFRENGLLPQDIRTDKIIQAIEQNLPADWELVQTEEDKAAFPNRFTLRAKYEVWQTQENLTNAPADVIQKVHSPEYYQKNGKKITPFIRFALHQPWRKIELDNIAYNEQNWQYFYANAQFFGLKVVDFAGIESKFTQIHLPEQVEFSPSQVYDRLYHFLKPQEIIGIAQRAKLGDAILTENGEVYYIDEKYSPWQKWTDAEIGKKVKLKATILTHNSDLPTRNEKGEIQQGVEGKINLLIRPERQLLEQEITLVGKLTAINTSNIVGKSYIGAYGLLTDDGKMYYLEGIENWHLKAKFMDKRLKITGIYSEIEREAAPQFREDKEKGLIKRIHQEAVIIYPTLTQIQLPELKKSLSLVVVFKKDIAQESTLRIMEYTDYPFWEGMDGSKGKAYYHKTGDKYHILFPSEEERQNCIAYLKNKPEIYEVYPPDWNIQKD